MSSDIGKSYEGLSCEITHLLQEDNKVTIRFTYNANTIENPEEDIALAHFMCIWEVKDGKLYEGYPEPLKEVSSTKDVVQKYQIRRYPRRMPF